MKFNRCFIILLLISSMIFLLSASDPLQKYGHVLKPNSAAPLKRNLYVPVPDIRDCLGYGGYCILVFDIDKNHQFVKRIPTQGMHPVYPSSGDVVDVETGKMITTLQDEFHNNVAREKMVGDRF